MLRRTFLTLLGTVAWPWRKAESLPAIKVTELASLTSGLKSAPVAHELGKSITYHCEVEIGRGLGDGSKFALLQNPCGYPIKFIPVRELPCDAATS